MPDDDQADLQRNGEAGDLQQVILHSDNAVRNSCSTAESTPALSLIDDEFIFIICHRVIYVLQFSCYTLEPKASEARLG